MGEDSGRLWADFQKSCARSDGGAIDCVRRRLRGSRRELGFIEIESNRLRFERRLAASGP